MNYIKSYRIYESESEEDSIKSKIFKLKSKQIEDIWDSTLQYQDDGFKVDFYLYLKGPLFEDDYNDDLIPLFKVEEDGSGFDLSTDGGAHGGELYFNDFYYDNKTIEWIMYENNPDLLIDDNLVYELIITTKTALSLDFPKNSIINRLRSMYKLKIVSNGFYGVRDGFVKIRFSLQ